MKSSGWLEIEKNWPALTGLRSKKYAEIYQSAYEFLLLQKIQVSSFSHYGVVVKNIDSSAVLSGHNSNKDSWL